MLAHLTQTDLYSDVSSENKTFSGNLTAVPVQY